MKKFCAALFALPATLVCFICSCSSKIDYYSFVSEYRRDAYIYEDDGVKLKVYLSEKETPYACDGIKGAMTSLCEIYFSRDDTPQKVEATLCGMGGEMSYMAVTRTYYLSFSGDIDPGATAEVKLDIDGEEFTYKAGNVREEATIDGQTALKCVTEYDGETFERLTQGKNFLGEIGIRLLYDDGCYYYVGVSDRQGNTHAYLVDGTDGRVISERQSSSQ